MCFGPSRAEREAAAQTRAEAESAQEDAATETAAQKEASVAEAVGSTKIRSIEAALKPKEIRRLGYGGRGRRSLFQSPTGAAGFLGRFNR